MGLVHCCDRPKGRIGVNGLYAIPNLRNDDDRFLDTVATVINQPQFEPC
jgi:hypothetical protein